MIKEIKKIIKYEILISFGCLLGVILFAAVLGILMLIIQSLDN